MSFRRRAGLLSALLFLLGTSSSYAYGDWFDDFGPYAENEKPAPVTLESMVTRARNVLGCNTSEEFGLKNSSAPFLLKADVTQDDRKKYKLVLQLTQPDPLPDLKLEIPDGAEVSAVYTADLNGDGQPDYVIPYTQSTGDLLTQEEGSESDRDENPYGAKGQCLLFLISSGRIMTAYNLDHAEMEEDAFVKGAGTDPVQFLSLRFLKDKDVKPKYQYENLTFLLYRPLVFTKAGEVKPPDAPDSRFPKFVSYVESSVRKNHKETKLLTEDQKKDLLQKNPMELVKLGPEVKDKTPPPAPKKPVKKHKKKHKNG